MMSTKNGEKRSPTSHRTPSQIVAHGRTYQASEQQKKNRALRNKARAAAMRAGLVKKGDNMDVAHKRSLMKGGSNQSTNVTIQPRSKNRAHGTRFKGK